MSNNYVISCISAGTGRMVLKIHISILQMLGLVVIIIIIKVNQSRYRPGVAQRVPGS
jgi:hypothetical protein